MCNLNKFPDLKAYLRHLESKKHENMKYSFHAKGAAILHFLRAESKLASQRRMLKSQRRGIKGPVMRCRKCQCDVFGYIREHAKTVEHIALRNYLRVDCCNNTYFNRADLEEHRLSLVHLKNQLEQKQKQKQMEDEEEEEEKTDDIGVPEDGLNFIQMKSHYRCEVCPQARLQSAKKTESHFKSLEHYNNLKSHLNKLEEEKELKKKRLEEEAAKAELEKKKQDEAKKKNGEQDEGEEISFEDMHNMETVDEASDDGDMETGGKVNHGAADDEDEILSGEDFDDDDDDMGEGGDDEDEAEEEGEGEEDAEDIEEEHEHPESCDDDKNEASASVTNHPKQEVKSEPKEEEDITMKEELIKKDETETKLESETKEGVKVQEPTVKEEDMPSQTKVKIEVATPRGRRGRGRGRGRAARN
ncbi:hypothetical protein OTU49_011550 [Cherax quadricarinatus]|uniref:Zinc finger protein on ecdysone puffs n=1 Tax=Cherax quadricarinatus TaxID=27406 RepID=A0AAW0W3P6_CHEQU